MMNWQKQFTQSPDGLLHAVLPALPALEAEALTWQRVDIALAIASPGAQFAFQALKKWLAQQKSCPDLRFTQLGNNTVTPYGLITAANGGQYGATTTARLFAIYIRKTAVAGSALASYLKLFDEGTDAAISGLTANSRLVIPLGAVSSAIPGTLQEGIYISPNGFPLAAGLRLALVTLADTFTISAVADGGDGFALTTP
jgi:hypothetical protein